MHTVWYQEKNWDLGGSDFYDVNFPLLADSIFHCYKQVFTQFRTWQIALLKNE